MSSNFKLGRGGNLYDKTTGQWVGLLDEDGDEQVVIPPGSTAVTATQSDQGLAFPNPDGAVFLRASTVSWKKSGAQNAAEMQALHDDLIGVGGTILLPDGEIQVSGGIETNAGRTGDYMGNSLTWRGQGMGATRLVMTDTSGPLFSKTEGHGHAWRDLTLIGPGVGTDAVAIDWLNAAGGALWENVWIHGFGAGSQFYDATSMTFVNCHWHGNGVNKRLGYNCDIFQYFGGRIQNAAGHGIHVGWRGPNQPVGSVLCAPVTLIGVRFGDNAGAAVFVDDVGCSQLTVQAGYFEHNNQLLLVGTAGTQQSAKQVAMKECFFTRPVSFTGLQIEVAEPNSDCTLEISNCTSDATYTGTFARIGATGGIKWDNNKIPTSGAGKQLQIGTGATYAIPDGATWGWNKNQILLSDGTLLATSEPSTAVRMTNGSGKIFAEWSRRSSSTGALVGSGHAYVTDINGQWVVFDGVHRIGTPSAALPTAAAVYRGVMAYQQGGAGAADTVAICMKSAGDTYSWKVAVTG